MSKNKITLKDLYQNEKYRARVILAFYFVLFFVLIVGLRGNQRYNNPNSKVEENTNNSEEENIVTEEKNTLKSFDLIRSENFEFDYYFENEGISYQITGKKFQDKELFEVVADNQYHIYYQSNKEETKAKLQDEEEYEIARKPYKYIDYFDVSLLEEILYSSTMVTEEVYEIENSKLGEILDYGNKIEGSTQITIFLQNGYITSISMDYSQFVKEVTNEENITKFTLKYSNFNLVDDFEITF